MDKSYWIGRWDRGEIGFHREDVNPDLIEFYSRLKLKRNDTIFLPLCGKTKDIEWLLAHGLSVVGAELSELAIKELFLELGVLPAVKQIESHQIWSARNLKIFLGDIFELRKADLGSVDAVYDRAALVALPSDMRKRYSQHLIDITETAQQLLITYEYDQLKMEGPPFSVPEEEARSLYENHYQIKLLTSDELPDGLRGECPASRSVWLLTQ